jgi:dTDP-4-dehydrorhamnose 3,5-epimerase
MLPGVMIKPLRRFSDERGSFTEVFRNDWKDLIENDQILQTNLSVTYPSLVRAWHKHERGQIDYFLVIRGTLKICAYDDKTQELTEIISTAEDLQITKIPGYYWHGIKAVSVESTSHVYFVNRLYDYKNPDEIRRVWNDPTIIPKSINGKTNDPRTGKPWDWFYPPHK